MSKADHAFKLSELARAVKALRQAGVLVTHVSIENGRIEMHTSNAAPPRAIKPPSRVSDPTAPNVAELTSAA